MWGARGELLGFGFRFVEAAEVAITLFLCDRLFAAGLRHVLGRGGLRDEFFREGLRLVVEAESARALLLP